MANITLMGASYSDVPAVQLPHTGGGTAMFYEETGTLQITENGAHNVSGYASVNVNVSGGGGGSVVITQDEDGYLVLDEDGGSAPVLVTKSITANGTYDPEDDDADGYSEVTVAIPSSSKNFQVSNTQVRLANKTSLSNTGLSLTVAETGTYNVYWSAFRTNTSSGYTWGSQLYIDGTSYGSENTTWSNSYNQINKLTGVSLTKDQVLNVYGRTRSGTSYYICVSNLIIEQTA